MRQRAVGGEQRVRNRNEAGKRGLPAFLDRTLRPLPTALCHVFTLLLVGCIHGKLPPQEFNRLRLPAPTDSIAAVEHSATAPTPPEGGIAIVPYVAPGLYGDRSIVFRINDTEYGSYPNRAWAIPVPAMLG